MMIRLFFFFFGQDCEECIKLEPTFSELEPCVYFYLINILLEELE